MELSTQITLMLQKSRADAGVSQADIARRLRVSKKTIQNWEAGVSCPRLDQSIEWFTTLRLAPFSYFFRTLNEEKVCDASSDEAVTKALHACINELTPEQKKKLLYCAISKHGSSPDGILNMVVAHLHTPLQDRVPVAAAIISNYKIAKQSGALIESADVLPDLNILERSYQNALIAASNGRNEYTNVEANNEIKRRNENETERLHRI